MILSDFQNCTSDGTFFLVRHRFNLAVTQKLRAIFLSYHNFFDIGFSFPIIIEFCACRTRHNFVKFEILSVGLDIVLKNYAQFGLDQYN